MVRIQGQNKAYRAVFSKVPQLHISMQVVPAILVTCSKFGGKILLLTIWVNWIFSMHARYICILCPRPFTRQLVRVVLKATFYLQSELGSICMIILLQLLISEIDFKLRETMASFTCMQYDYYDIIMHDALYSHAVFNKSEHNQNSEVHKLCSFLYQTSLLIDSDP